MLYKQEQKALLQYFFDAFFGYLATLFTDIIIQYFIDFVNSSRKKFNSKTLFTSSSFEEKMIITENDDNTC